MDAVVDIPLVALAVATLGVAAWAASTSTRAMVWFLTAALLWLGTASFVSSALLGTPLALLVLGWSLSVAAVLVGAYALFGRPGRVGHAELDIRHAVNVR